MLLLFLFTGLLLTVRLRGIQFRKLHLGFRAIIPNKDNEKGSSYGALCTALAATIGTGNIVGVATALSVGGPGALFWMLAAGTLSMATQFSEGFLAIRYRADTDPCGGPFRYMERGLRRKGLGKLYAFLVSVAGFLGVGTVVQVNSIARSVEELFPSEVVFGNCSVPALWAGVCVCLCSGFVILGGGKRITKVCEYLVPLMTGIFLFCSAVLLFCRRREIPLALSLIWRGAFAPKAVLGAGVGVGLQQVVRMGISRGVFTNEAGMGTSAIAAASSGVKDPYSQGLVSMSATFIDTLVICTVSGLCLIVGNGWTMPFEGGQLMTLAWEISLPWHENISCILLNLCLIFFAFATILGWGFYAEACLRYLTGGRGLKLYRVAYVSTLLAGPFFSVSSVFYLADIFNGLMSVPNLLAILFLHEEVVKEVRKKD